MKKMIIDKIEELGGNISFVELQELPGFSGDKALGRPELSHVYWINVSDAFVQAIHELVRDRVVEIEATSILTYPIDNKRLPNKR